MSASESIDFHIPDTTFIPGLSPGMNQISVSRTNNSPIPLLISTIVLDFQGVF